MAVEPGKSNNLTGPQLNGLILRAGLVSDAWRALGQAPAFPSPVDRLDVAHGGDEIAPRKAPIRDVGDDDPVLHRHYPIGNGEDLVQPMGDQDARDPPRRRGADVVKELL